ncbi:hypothetical protein AB1Y20_003756 [Prymnesium parvum]|uniref:Uncharacterized protein n=1 Tax=Prymnesium parvum TaxID=97485 RepID=A0AB34J7R6_PRYPA
MKRDVQHTVIRLEDVLGPVPVMHIPVNDGNSRHYLKGCSRSNCDVIVETKAHRFFSLCMVTWRPNERKRASNFLPEHRVGRLEDSPCSGPGCLFSPSVEVYRAVSMRLVFTCVDAQEFAVCCKSLRKALAVL